MRISSISASDNSFWELLLAFYPVKARLVLFLPLDGILVSWPRTVPRILLVSTSHLFVGVLGLGMCATMAGCFCCCCLFLVSSGNQIPV